MSTNENWQIIYYSSPNGKCPVHDFIDKLNATSQAKIANTFDLLEQYGNKIGHPHVKKLISFGIWELRILGSANIID